MVIEPKPCPFCGYDKPWVNRECLHFAQAWVACRCGAEGPVSGVESPDDEDGAIRAGVEAWNRRVEPLRSKGP